MGSIIDKSDVVRSLISEEFEYDMRWNYRKAVVSPFVRLNL